MSWGSGPIRKDASCERGTGVFDRVFYIALALVAVGDLAYGLATGQELLTALGGIAVGGCAARLRWGPRW
jgi:hypothetical protein